MKFNTIDEAIKEFKRGNFVIVCDDEDRENEGDLILAAEFATPEKINFMIKVWSRPHLRPNGEKKAL